MLVGFLITSLLAIDPARVKKRKIFFNAAGLYGNKHNIELFFSLFLNDAAVRVRLEIPIILLIFSEPIVTKGFRMQTTRIYSSIK